MVYLIALFFISVGIYTYDYKKVKQGNLFLWILLCIYLICVSGLRYRLGGDTINYMMEFKSLHPISNISWKEITTSRYAPGYMVLISTFKEISPSFYVFQFFNSLVLNTIVFYFLYKNCKHKFFAALIYFFYLYFFLSFEQIREAISVSIFLLAWPFFRDGKWVYWYISALCAMLFHLSASCMLILPIIMIPGIKQVFIFGKRTVLFLILFFILGFVIQKQLFRYIELLSLTQSITERAMAYERSILGSSEFNILGLIGNFCDFILYPFLFLLLFYKQDNLNSNSRFDKLKSFVIISIYISTLSLNINILNRFNNYFFFFVIVYISNCTFKNIIINKKKIQLKFVTWMLIMVPMFLIHIYCNYYNPFSNSVFAQSYKRYYPYNSIFNENRDPEREKTIRMIQRKV